jgi:predicted nuclease of predicted toxin-antitoxin system
VIFWVDAQLPPALAHWLAERFRVEARAVRDLGLREAEDPVIFERARTGEDVVLISKDSDFIELITRRGPPPRLLWVTCGNVTNQRLRAVFAAVFQSACDLLLEGRHVVEIGDKDRPIC